MAEEHIETLRRIAEAANNQDPALLDEFLDPGVFWNVRENGPDLIGTYHGIEEVRAFFDRWVQAWDEWEWGWPEMRACGDTATTRTSPRGTAPSMPPGCRTSGE
jgi:SnoaL-like protein